MKLKSRRKKTYKKKERITYIFVKREHLKKNKENQTDEDSFFSFYRFMFSIVVSTVAVLKWY